ncbi:hypothetical protein HPB50_018545 [Hyalomma asiaticum]|uniref:Uncharacterized protein n=1 Tax=Hyalomma asiaticum TaxID=266040 RepID=A0ACB7TK08_HYAAI|nr:hypothetical protein HPB50_018545 [Hyalomma asiaticum]
MASCSGSQRRLVRDNKAGREDGMSLPDAPHIFLAAALSPPPNSFFEFSGRRRSKAKGQLLPAGNSWPALHPPPTPFPLARHVRRPLPSLADNSNRLGLSLRRRRNPDQFRGCFY